MKLKLQALIPSVQLSGLADRSKGDTYNYHQHVKVLGLCPPTHGTIGISPHMCLFSWPLISTQSIQIGTHKSDSDFQDKWHFGQKSTPHLVCGNFEGKVAVFLKV